MSLLDSIFDPTTLAEDDLASEYAAEYDKTGELGVPITLSTLLLSLGSDPSKNLIATLEFGPQFLGCLRLSYGPTEEQRELPNSSQFLQIPLENDSKTLTLFGLQEHPDTEKLTIFTALLAQQECRLRDFVRVNSLEEYTKTLFEACPDGIVVTDDFGVILNANRAMVALTRKPKETLNGLRVSQLTDSKGRAQAFKAVRRLKEHHRARFDCRIHVGGKRTIPVSVSFRDFHFQGRPLILATLRDLSDLEDEVTRCTTYEQSLAHSIENATDGFVRYDQFGRITEANPHVEKLTGLDPLRLVGRPIDDILDVSALREFRKGISQLQETGYASFPCQVSHTDGSPKDVQATLMQLEVEGERYCRMMLQDTQNLPFNTVARESENQGHESSALS